MLKEASQIPIHPPVFDAVSSYGIASIALVVAVLYILVLARGDGKRLARLALGALLLLGASAAAAVSGLLARFDVLPPPMAIMVRAKHGASRHKVSPGRAKRGATRHKVSPGRAKHGDTRHKVSPEVIEKRFRRSRRRWLQID
jgi:hypothetical protein